MEMVIMVEVIACLTRIYRDPVGYGSARSWLHSSPHPVGEPAKKKPRVAPLPRGKDASRIALPRTSTGLAGNTAQLANGQERAASKSSGVLSQASRLRRAWASRATSGSGRSCCGLVAKNFYFPDGGGSSCSLLRMRSISLTIPTTRRLLANTGRHGRSTSRMISRASSSD